jgi:hypothetical protein
VIHFACPTCRKVLKTPPGLSGATVAQKWEESSKGLREAIDGDTAKEVLQRVLEALPGERISESWFREFGPSSNTTCADGWKRSNREQC